MPPESSPFPIQFFDPKQDVRIAERRLPHWYQAGVVCFITWRNWDSIPKPVLESWLDERRRFLQRLGIDDAADDWRRRVQSLPPSTRAQFYRTFSDRWNDQLDACHGTCVLRRPELTGIVANSLHHFDGDRYELTDYVVMPNHVHLLVAFPSEDAMLAQCESWKHFTATRINGKLERKDRFGQQDGFDHLVRSTEEFEYLRRYIADNPHRARLRSEEYIHYLKKLT
jgi:REP-associated tyrosine transposase